MTADQLVLACIAHEDEWVDITGKPVGFTAIDMIDPDKVTYPIFNYEPGDPRFPWAIDPGKYVQIEVFASTEQFKQAAQVHLDAKREA